jgi:membrane fusion protein (multidrug efflux system)
MKSIWAGLGMVLLVTACSQDEQAFAPPTVEVGVVTLHTQSVALQSELAGRLRAWQMSDVRPQVSGIVKARRFEEGETVKAGQVLYQIEPATYQAAYDSALAALANAQATVAAAKLKAERYADLIDIQAVARQDADDAQASYKQAVATVAQNQAAVESARINLGFTQVRAPISGRIGTSTVTAGALVTASQTTALATIRVLDPIYVDLTQSSVELLKLKKGLAAGGIKAASAPVSLKLEDGTGYSQKGVLKFSEVSVDEATGSVTLRAVFPNPDGMLLPGMYVRAVLDEAVDTRAILAPQQGVTRDAKGVATSLVVDAKNQVEQRSLVTQRAVGDKWLVSSGLKDGDRLIVQGVGNVKVGDTVKVVAVDTPAATASQATPVADARN